VGEPFLDAQHPADPYPGSVPGFSFVHDSGRGWPLRPDPTVLSGWRVGGTDLDDWLIARGVPPLSERLPVLTYGSNRCPAKITWLRDHLGLTGPAVVLRARTHGLAAVWAAGLRARDGQRPATLCALPEVVEEHAVWLATPEQLCVLDRCEGRGQRYRLSRLHTGRVELENGARLDGVLAYTAAAPMRQPLLVDGRPVRCADLEQAAALELTGRPGPDGLAVTEVTGTPEPAAWPDRLFVYGTLQPGATAWPLLARHAADEPRRTAVHGRLYDTGLGYPALHPGGETEVPGWVVRLRAPVTAFRELDAYEGEDYRRVRVVLPDGSLCWTYAWIADTAALRELDRWPAA